MQVAGRGPVSAVSASAALQRAQQSIAMLRDIVRDAKLRERVGGTQELLLTHYNRGCHFEGPMLCKIHFAS